MGGRGRYLAKETVAKLTQPCTVLQKLSHLIFFFHNTLTLLLLVTLILEKEIGQTEI